VTFWNFIAMGAATIGVMHYVEIRSFAGFLVMFLILFVTTGVGNGSTFRMIPSIRAEKLREAKAWATWPGRWPSRRPVSRVRPCSASHRRSAPGGGYLIPRGFGASIAATGGPNLALEVFLTFYVTCVALTWWFYMRKSFLVQRAPSLAEARV